MLYATGKVTFAGQPANADTVTIGSVTYAFKSGALVAANDVKIGAAVQDTITNLRDAVNLVQATKTVAYHTSTVPNVQFDAEVGINTLFVKSWRKGTTGNSLALAKSGTNLSVSAATLLGGIKGGEVQKAIGRYGLKGLPVADEVVVIGANTYTWKASAAGAFEVTIGADVAASLANLLAKIIANDTNIVASVLGGILSMYHKTAGAAANTYVLTTTSTNASVSGAGTFVDGKDATLFDRSTLSWIRMRVSNLDYSEVQMQETLDPEIGGVVTPTGAYKSGVALAGGADMYGRLQNSMGHILYAAMGAVSTASLGSGVYAHTFKFATDAQYQPWMAVRKMIPGRENADPLGLLGFDNKVAGLQMTVAAARPVMMRLDLVGRYPEHDRHPDVWTGSTFEDFTTIPLSCKGTFKLPTIPDFPSPLPTTQVSVGISNATTGPREEMIVGSYYMDDIITRLRALTFRFIYKWKDPALMDYLFGNANKVTTWDPAPFRTTTSGSDYAVDLLLQASANIGSTTTPYSLRIVANDVYWEPGAPVRMQGGGIVMMEVRGTVLAPASSDYVQFILTNGTTSYALPSEP